AAGQEGARAEHGPADRVPRGELEQRAELGARVRLLEQAPRRVVVELRVDGLAVGREAGQPLADHGARAAQRLAVARGELGATLVEQAVGLLDDAVPLAARGELVDASQPVLEVLV